MAIKSIAFRFVLGVTIRLLLGLGLVGLYIGLNESIPGVSGILAVGLSGGVIASPVQTVFAG